MKFQSTVFLCGFLAFSHLPQSNCQSSTTSSSPSPLPTATIDSGAIVGTTTVIPGAASTLVHKYLGIPFAAPVVRWSLPSPPAPWGRTTPRNCSAFGPICLQSFVGGTFGPDPALLRALTEGGVPLPESEDCLTINVYVPVPAGNGSAGGRACEAKGKGKAVFVYMPGGAFLLGGSASYDAAGFAAFEDVVFVTFNYRTNVFGFPPPPLPRNLGLHDQRLALSWVSRNIASFGGDPSKVTLGGVSAGSMSIDAMLTLPDVAQSAKDKKSKLPFRAAVMQSGQLSYGFLSLRGNSTGEWQTLASAVNCSSPGNDSAIDTPQLECMRHVPGAALIAAQESIVLAFTPIYDNATLFQTPGKARGSGNFATVPTLTGTTADEGRLLVNQNVNLTQFLDIYLPESLVTAEGRQAILAAYPRGAGNVTKSDFDIAAEMYTEAVFQCPQALLSRSSSSPTTPTYRYIFNSTFTSILPPSLSFLGAFHGADAVLLFADFTLLLQYLPPEVQQLVAYMRNAYGSFVRDPLGPGPGWPDVASGGEWKDSPVAVLGNVGDVVGSGATVVKSGWGTNGAVGAGVDARCALFEGLYDRLQVVAAA